MGCNCGGGTRAASSKFVVEVANSGGVRTSKYRTATEARAAATSGGGTAYQVQPDGTKVRL